jgi:hypothetical protein
MTSGWYYAKAGAAAGSEIGPLTWEELYLLAQGGTLAPADIVWNPKLPRGVTAGLIPGLFAIPVAPQVPPVQPAPQPMPTPQPATPAPITPQPAVLQPTAAPVAVPPPVSPQPAPPPQLIIPAQPAAVEAARPLWDLAPAAVHPTPDPAKVQAASEVHDLFAEKLEETGGEEAPPEGPRPPKKERQNRSLPWLVVLLVLVVAAAAVAAYFLYFRDISGNSTSSTVTSVTGMTTTTAFGGTTPAVWTELVTSGETPVARSYFAMAYDPTTDRTILFGGSAGDTKFGDTWAIDLASETWTKIATTGSSPPARDYCQMIYDPVDNKLLLFGGAGVLGDLNDLWAFDVTSNSWAELKPSGAVPPAREGHAMLYEPNKKQVLVFGGLNSDPGTLFNDLWAYDTADKTWAKVDPAGAPPSERESSTMAYCPASQRVLLFGGLSLGDDTDAELGDMWAYDPVAETWGEVKPTGITPSARLGQGMAGAPALGGLFLFGGRLGDTDLDDSWMFNSLDDTWAQLQPGGGGPEARDGHVMAYDSSAGSVVLFGGFDSGASVDLGDTWVYGPARSDSAP